MVALVGWFHIGGQCRITYSNFTNTCIFFVFNIGWLRTNIFPLAYRNAKITKSTFYLNQFCGHLRRDAMLKMKSAWWRHQMETFSALLAICAENSPVPGEFPAQRPVTRSFDVLFDPHPNKRLGKQSWGWWSETPSSSLWRHRNGWIIHGWNISVFSWLEQ